MFHPCHPISVYSGHVARLGKVEMENGTDRWSLMQLPSHPGVFGFFVFAFLLLLFCSCMRSLKVEVLGYEVCGIVCVPTSVGGVFMWRTQHELSPLHAPLHPHTHTHTLPWRTLHALSLFAHLQHPHPTFRF